MHSINLKKTKGGEKRMKTCCEEEDPRRKESHQGWSSVKGGFSQVIMGGGVIQSVEKRGRGAGKRVFFH